MLEVMTMSLVVVTDRLRERMRLARRLRSGFRSVGDPLSSGDRL